MFTSPPGCCAALEIEKSFYLHITHLTDDKSAKHLAKTVEHEGIRDIQILMADPVLLRYCSLLVVSVVVVVAMSTSWRGHKNVSTLEEKLRLFKCASF